MHKLLLSIGVDPDGVQWHACTSLSDHTAGAAARDFILKESKHFPPPFPSVLKGISPPLSHTHFPLPPLPATSWGEGSSCQFQLGCTGAVLSPGLWQQQQWSGAFLILACFPQLFLASSGAGTERGNMPPGHCCCCHNPWEYSPCTNQLEQAGSHLTPWIVPGRGRQERQGNRRGRDGKGREGRGTCFWEERGRDVENAHLPWDLDGDAGAAAESLPAPGVGRRET